MIEPFTSNAFMANALAAGVIVSVACGIVGTFMVLRGLAFIGDALAHGVLPGIAVALLLGYPGILGAAAGSALMVGGIGYLARRTRLTNDTTIGLFFVGMLALGVIIVSRSASFSGDLVRVLFGELLGITPAGIAVQAAATLLIAGVTLVLRRPFLLLCVDPEQAAVAGWKPRRLHAAMLAMIALTIVVSFQTVGTLLVFGMLLAPAAASALFSRRLLPMMVLASLLGAASVYLGLLASYHLDLAAGAAITLVATAIFFVSFALSRLTRGKRGSRRRPQKPAPAGEARP